MTAFHEEDEFLARNDDREDVGLAIVMLRSLPNPPWTQSELSRRSGVEQSQISDYELGKARPRRTTLARLAVPAGVEVSFFDQLIPICRGIRLAYERALRRGQAGAPAETVPGLEGRMAQAIREAMAPFLLLLSQQDREPASRAGDRAWAAERWSKLQRLPAEKQDLLIGVLLGDDRSWALAETLCLASAGAAAGRASEARRLARLAIRVAEQCPAAESWRRRFRVWCAQRMHGALEKP